MSERLKSTTQFSNEDIIEDITKDLKSSLSTEEKAQEFVIDPDAKAEYLPSSSGDAPASKSSNIPPTTTTPLLDSMLEKDEKEEESDSDSINEVDLKDTEVDLTDDQKAERKIIAEELKGIGNDAFKDRDYERSVDKYTEALNTCPLQFSQLRAVLYCNRSAAKMKLEKYKKAIKDCTKAIELDDKYLKAYVRRAQCYEATDKLDECLADYNKVLELDPDHSEARKAAIRLPPLIEERNEKLKTEMMSKLKDLGNMILKPFGLSTENFKMEQDPDSKGYKINFQQ